jgi:3-hydroxymyristoyl/3-hydroxydecanoyl-(acyl carrier protein) dehydratase
VLASAIRKILLSNLVEPTVENIARTETSWSADFTFDPKAPYFKGHFPNFSILPGVVQLGIAHHFAQAFLRRDFTIGCVKKMKFSRPILPGERIRFSLEKKSEDELGYTYAKGEAICSSGCLVLSA